MRADYDVVIAGAGPAGSSAAIRLSMIGARVLLVEQKKFPRAKLCGEFISPECLDHFYKLGVLDQMTSAGGRVVTQTIFYSRSGRAIKVPSSWFGGEHAALGLSRSEMDHRLLTRAREVGVTVLEETQVTATLKVGDHVIGVTLKDQNGSYEVRAAIVIDATGRNRSLAEPVSHKSKKERPSLVAFKAHLENAEPERGTCEIYSYRGGYGGLSPVENGLSNLCFIAASHDVRRCEADPDTAMRELVRQNSRAAQTLAKAHVHDRWLAVALKSFGRYQPAPTNGLLTIGDAAAFIDPFSGSGMLMALESGELAANTIAARLDGLRDGRLFEELRRDYRSQYERQFGKRLRICGLLRRVAFLPRLAEMAIGVFSTSERLRFAAARATRGRRTNPKTRASLRVE